MERIADSLLTVRFEATGVDLTDIISWSITSDYTTSADGFTFVAYVSDPEVLRHLEMAPVELIVNGASQLLGRIDASEVGSQGRAWTFHGRDYVADIVECNVDPLAKVKEDDTIASAFTLCAGPCGVDTIVSDDDIAMRDVRTGVSVKTTRSGRGYAKRALKEMKPAKGEGVYEFLNRLIARFGATIQPGRSRSELVVTSPDYQQTPLYSLFRSDSPELEAMNNVQSSSATRDYSSFPTYALFTGWQAGSADDRASSNVAEYDINRLAYLQNTEIARTMADSTVSGRRKPLASDVPGLGQLYRLLHFHDDQARDGEQLQFAALRAIADRLKSTLEYRCTVRGHVDLASGAVWSVDTMVHVEDDICNVHEDLWIKERTLVFSPSDGATTELVCYRPSSFFFGTLDETVPSVPSPPGDDRPAKPAPLTPDQLAHPERRPNAPKGPIR